MVNRSIFPVWLLAAASLAAGPPRIEFADPARSWAEALPVENARVAALVRETPAETRLRWFFSRPDWFGAVREGLAGPLSRHDGPVPEGGGVTIEWLTDAGPGTFGRVLEVDGRVVSRLRIGQTTVTRTVLADPGGGPIFIHLLADMPGALAFRVTLVPPAEGPVSIENRRQLVWTAAGAGEPPEVREARLWVLPFESEVGPEDAAIVVRGEGEALIVLDFGTESREETLAGLGRNYDPGRTPPDPVRIWHGVSAAAAAGQP